MLCVTLDTMPWARKRLDQLRILHTPIAEITNGLRVDAIQWLLKIGVDDFLTVNCNLEELQLRLQRLCDDWEIKFGTEENPSGGTCILR